jgi:hypothetical protein
MLRERVGAWEERKMKEACVCVRDERWKERESCQTRSMAKTEQDRA